MKNNIIKVTREFIVFAYGVLTKQYKQKIKSNKESVLLIIELGLGDFILFLSFIKNAIDFYGEENVVIAANKRDINLLHCFMEYSEVECIETNSNWNDTSIKEQISTIKTLRGYGFKKIINAYDISLHTDIILSALQGKKYTIIDRKEERKYKGKWYREEIRKCAYTDILYTDPDLMMLRKYSLLFERCTGKKMLSEAPKLYLEDNGEFPLIKNDTGYILLAAGSMMYARCWATDKFEAVVQYLLENTDFNIYLTGSSNSIDMEVNEKISERFRNDNRVIPLSGKLGFKEWMSIVSKASIVIGNDSGIIHMASLLNVPSIVAVCGYFCGRTFMPYDTDIENTSKLFTVRAKQPACSICRLNDRKYGSRNKNCMRRIKAGLSAECLDNVNVDDVIFVIKRVLSSEDRD